MLEEVKKSFHLILSKLHKVVKFKGMLHNLMDEIKEQKKYGQNNLWLTVKNG